ncbi:MAG: aspartate/glutamate racemase family protein [bacterium]
MGLRILIVHPLPRAGQKASDDLAGAWGVRPMGGFYEDIIQKSAERVTKPDTKVTQWFPDKYSGSLQNLYLSTVTSMPLVNRIIKAEEEGYDAAVLGCHSDNGVQIARAVAHIPVIGPCEASMAVGSFIGEKFAMVTIREQYLRMLEHHIRMFGFEDRFIKDRPIRWFDRWVWNDMMDAHRGKPEKLIELFERTALECVKDGADTILVPGFPLGPALSLAGYTEVAKTGVRIVDGASAAFKMAELLADLRKSIGMSRTTAQSSQYQGFPREMLKKVFRDFGF